MAKLPWNWRQRIEISLVERSDELQFRLQWKKGKTPRGRARAIGLIATTRNGFVVESFVEDRFQRRGLGSMLYRHALQHVGQLTTKWRGHSTYARYVWDSLIAEYQYKTDFFSDKLTVRNRRRPLSRR